MVLLIEYVVAKIGHNKWSIAKFMETKAPVAVYIIEKKTEHSYRCNCPNRWGPCKHWGMIDEWLQRGSPLPSCFKEIHHATSHNENTSTTHFSGPSSRRIHLRVNVRTGGSHQRK